MPIVFVHGVNTRKTDPGYDARLAMIAKFIQAHFAGVAFGEVPLATLTPMFPYWGDLATTFAWNMASLPSGEIDALGAPGVVDDMRSLIGVMADGLKDPSHAKDEPLLTLARERSLTLAVDVVTDQLLRETAAADADRVAEFVVSARRYAEAQPKPAWMAGLATDEQLLNLLIAELQKGAVPPAGINALGGGFGRSSVPSRRRAGGSSRPFTPRRAPCWIAPATSLRRSCSGGSENRSTPHSAVSSATSSSISTDEVTRLRLATSPSSS